MFINPANSDFHIATNSPCIDSGAPATLTKQEDLDGRHRPMDGDADGRSRLDIGCYEVSNLRGDSDEDGMSDGDEAVADTSPYDAASIFRISAISTNASGEVTLSFTSSAARFYTMMQRTNLVSGAWSNVPGMGPHPGTGGADSITKTNATDKTMFYKLKVFQ
jgi:hypothetical protein